MADDNEDPDTDLDFLDDVKDPEPTDVSAMEKYRNLGGIEKPRKKRGNKMKRDESPEEDVLAADNPHMYKSPEADLFERTNKLRQALKVFESRIDAKTQKHILSLWENTQDLHNPQALYAELVRIRGIEPMDADRIVRIVYPQTAPQQAQVPGFYGYPYQQQMPPGTWPQGPGQFPGQFPPQQFIPPFQGQFPPQGPYQGAQQPETYTKEDVSRIVREELRAAEEARQEQEEKNRVEALMAEVAALRRVVEQGPPPSKDDGGPAIELKMQAQIAEMARAMDAKLSAVKEDSLQARMTYERTIDQLNSEIRTLEREAQADKARMQEKLEDREAQLQKMPRTGDPELDAKLKEIDTKVDMAKDLTDKLFRAWEIKQKAERPMNTWAPSQAPPPPSSGYVSHPVPERTPAPVAPTPASPPSADAPVKRRPRTPAPTGSPAPASEVAALNG